MGCIPSDCTRPSECCDCMHTIFNQMVHNRNELIEVTSRKKHKNSVHFNAYLKTSKWDNFFYIGAF